jgi:D-sedoheptulose 7-phosphate isomerase
MESIVKQRFLDSIAVKQAVVENDELIRNVDELAECLAETIRHGNKLVLCGNGGSASDALHFAGEIVGRFQLERNPWPAVVLNADVATMTAIANDYGYDNVFAREAKGQLKPGDLFIGISTSGNSENVLRAVNVAKEVGAKTGALLGRDGGKIAPLVDYPVVVACQNTARIQESHITIIHSICEMVETELSSEH